MEVTNLQRQILHTDDRVGDSKVDSATQTLKALNPDITVEGFETRLTSDNIMDIMEGYDLVIDGGDNFPTRYLINDACVKAGIDKPIVPGVLPIENWKGARRFAESCGTFIPDWVIDAFEKAERDGRSDLLATAICTELCSDLIEGGVDKLHFYTLNRPELTRDVCFALGVTPEAKLENVA